MDRGIKQIVATDTGMLPVIPPGALLECVSSLPDHGDLIVIQAHQNHTQLIRIFQRRPDQSILLQAIRPGSKNFMTSEEELWQKGEISIVRRITLPGFPVRIQEAAAFSQTGGISAQPDTDFLTFEEAQALLKLKRTRMYALLQSGKLEASKVGKLWRIRRSAIQRYFEAQSYEKDKPAPVS